MTSELRNRLVFGLVFAAVVVAVVASDVLRGSLLGVTALALLAAVAGSREFVRLARSAAPGVALAPVLLTNALLVLLPLLVPLVRERAPQLPAVGEVAVVVIGLALGWMLLEQMFRRGPEGIFAHVGAQALGIVYLGIPLLLLLRLAEQERGGQLLLVFIATVKCGDISAYFGGKAFGRRKLCPSISPGKTWEGFICSFAGAIAGSYLFAWLPTTWGSPAPFAGWWQPVVWGVVIGPLGVLGDLAESCFKRAAGAKDSGTFLPGFGGMLDVLDALIIAAPAAYLLSRCL